MPAPQAPSCDNRGQLEPHRRQQRGSSLRPPNVTGRMSLQYVREFQGRVTADVRRSGSSTTSRNKPAATVSGCKSKPPKTAPNHDANRRTSTSRRASRLPRRHADPCRLFCESQATISSSRMLRRTAYPDHCLTSKP